MEWGWEIPQICVDAEKFLVSKPFSGNMRSQFEVTVKTAAKLRSQGVPKR